MINKRNTFKAVGVVAAAGLLTVACGDNGDNTAAAPEVDNYPAQSITLVVPWAAGGGTDAVGRALAESMSQIAGVDVVVENQEGAGSTIGTAYVQNSDADGYTLLLNTGSVITQTFVSRHEGTDTVDYEKLIPVAATNVDPYVLEVGPDAPWASMGEFLDHARENPGTVQVGIAGIGSHSQLAVPMVGSEAGVEFDQITFDGSGPINVALMGGHIDAHMPALGDFVSFIEDESIKLLAIAADERDERFPDTPTFKEEGVDLSYGLFRGVWIPADTPSDIVKQLEELVLEAAATDSYRDTLEDLGYGHTLWTNDEFEAQVDEQAVLLEQLMRDEGLID